MPIVSSNLGRTTPMMLGDQLYAQIARTQQELLEKQTEITTGKSVNRPSDAPDKAAAILLLQRQLAAREQHDHNLDHALGMLNNIDQAFSDATDLLRQAKSTASSQVGAGSDTSTRATQAHLITSQIQAMMTIGNRQYNNLPLFAGNQGLPSNGVVFESFLGGVRYLGSTQNLQADVGGVRDQPFTSNGLTGFGALSSRVASMVDLAPNATANTLVADVGGATGEGIGKGSVVVNVDGTQVTVDLASIDKLGDVTTRINQAIASVDPTAGSLALAGQGFALTAAAGHTISITSSAVGGGAAGELGVALTAASATVAGSSVRPKLTATTKLTDLGTAVDWASGMTITQGNVTKTIDFSGAQTIQDMMNAVDQLNLGVRLQINQAGDGLDLISEVSGPALSVGENGGTTAADLGLRTFGATTKLSAFRNGLGVENIQGEDDFSISLHNGTTFKVNIDGATNVGDVIADIQSAATAAGVTLGTDFTVGLAATGNGMTFADNTVGGGDFQIQDVGQSHAAGNLGISKNAGAATALVGEDNAKVRVDGVFTHLMDLRDALAQDDTPGITLAGSRIEDDLNNVIQARGQAGVEAQQAQQRQSRSQDLKLMEQTMLSNLQDADLPKVITRFAQLQQQLQASLQVGAQNMHLSLLDFLR